MSVQSDRVKRWRKHCKERIIAAMGGKCCVCGYNRCSAALALHHLDPTQKDIGLGAIRANPKNWNDIVVELRKCVLICHNCHNEVHYHMAVVPDDAPKFDERYADYKEMERQEAMTPCPVCDKLKSPHLKNCSVECAARSKYRVDWDNVNLKEELKTKSIIALSEQIGCSDAAIHKRLKKFGLK